MENTFSENCIILRNGTKETLRLEELFESRGLSKNAFIEAYKEKLVERNGITVKRNAKIPPGEEVLLRIAPEISDYAAEPEPLRILLEDSHFLAVEKPEGIPMLPAAGHTDGSLANRIQAYFTMTGLRRKIRFMNRLDQGTSGIVLLAKHKYAQSLIQNQMDEGSVTKKYLAIVEGAPRKKAGIITQRLQKDPESHRYIPHTEGKSAKTEYTVLIPGDDRSLLLLTLFTGRTHQLRSHLQSMGHPIAGDVLYGASSASRIFLHACFYRFRDWNGRPRSVISLPGVEWGELLGLTKDKWDMRVRNVLG